MTYLGTDFHLDGLYIIIQVLEDIRCLKNESLWGHEYVWLTFANIYSNKSIKQSEIMYGDPGNRD